MSKSFIVYQDVAPGAAEDAVATSAAAFSAISDLRVTQSRAEVAHITLEHNRWILNGTFDALDSKVAFWSAEISGDDCSFTTPPVIDMAFDEKYSSIGITFTFDPGAKEFCSRVNVKWYQGSTLLSNKDFSPDAATYFCENSVVGWNRVVVTVHSTSLPNRRARISNIAFGKIRRFDMSSLRQVKLVNELDVSAIELPVSSMSWSLDTRDTVAFMFQLKQPVECWHDDTLLGVYYIDSHKRNGVGKYSIECYDALGVLNESMFSGGVYSKKSAQTLLREMVDGAFPLVFDVDDQTVTGAILPCTKREAIQQVLFATGWCVATDGQTGIRVLLPAETAEHIGQERTLTGVSVETSSIVTEVTVVSHAYTKSSSGSVEINGEKYVDTTKQHTVTNPNVTANDKKNVKEIQNATLVSPDIGSAVAQRIYNYFLRRDRLKAKFVWRGEKLGALVTLPTPWETEETGHIEKMEIHLSNTIVATGESLGV